MGNSLAEASRREVWLIDKEISKSQGDTVRRLMCHMGQQSAEIIFETEKEYANGWKIGNMTTFHGIVTHDGITWNATLRIFSSGKGEITLVHFKSK